MENYGQREKPKVNCGLVGEGWLSMWDSQIIISVGFTYDSYDNDDNDNKDNLKGNDKDNHTDDYEDNINFFLKG